MAQAPNTGIPPAGAPQPEAGNQTQPPRKYAGKYDSLEDAVEKGYVGLEQQVGGLAEKLANLTRLLEVAVAPQDPVPTVGSASYGQPGLDPYGRGTPPQPNNYTVDFLTDPARHLQARDDALLQRVTGVVTTTVQNAMAVADFKSKNPDLIKHEPLVRTFMGQTDPRKSITERLEEAGKAARAYIAQNFQAPANPAPGGGNYVEPPRGPVVSFPPGSPPPTAPSTTEDEQAVVDYLNSRNALKAEQMGVGYDPNAK